MTLIEKLTQLENEIFENFYFKPENKMDRIDIPLMDYSSLKWFVSGKSLFYITEDELILEEYIPYIFNDLDESLKYEPFYNFGILSKDNESLGFFAFFNDVRFDNQFIQNAFCILNKENQITDMNDIQKAIERHNYLVESYEYEKSIYAYRGRIKRHATPSDIKSFDEIFYGKPIKFKNEFIPDFKLLSDEDRKELMESLEQKERDCSDTDDIPF